MHVQEQRLLEQARRNVETVGAHDDAIDCFGKLRLLRLVHGDAEPVRRFLCGRRRDLASSSLRRVGTCEQKRDLVRGGEALEHVGSERRGRGDADAHYRRTARGRSVESASLRCSSSVRSRISTPSR